MTCDDIIRMAKEAGSVAFNSEYIDGLERFAALVAAAERERYRMAGSDNVSIRKIVQEQEGSK